MHTNTRHAVSALLALIGIGILGVVQAACPGATSQGNANCIYHGDFTVVADTRAGTNGSIVASSMFPFQRQSTAKDLQRQYQIATASLTSGQAFRNAMTALTLDFDPTHSIASPRP